MKTSLSECLGETQWCECVPRRCVSGVHGWPKGAPCSWAAGSILVMGHESREAPSMHWGRRLWRSPHAWTHWWHHVWTLTGPSRGLHPFTSPVNSLGVRHWIQSQNGCSPRSSTPLFLSEPYLTCLEFSLQKAVQTPPLSPVKNHLLLPRVVWRPQPWRPSTSAPHFATLF